MSERPHPFALRLRKCVHLETLLKASAERGVESEAGLQPNGSGLGVEVLACLSSTYRGWGTNCTSFRCPTSDRYSPDSGASSHNAAAVRRDNVCFFAHSDT